MPPLVYDVLAWYCWPKLPARFPPPQYKGSFYFDILLKETPHGLSSRTLKALVRLEVKQNSRMSVLEVLFIHQLYDKKSLNFRAPSVANGKILNNPGEFIVRTVNWTPSLGET